MIPRREPMKSRPEQHLLRRPSKEDAAWHKRRCGTDHQLARAMPWP